MTSFTHLHVASGYSLQHGASAPHVLVSRAAELGLPALALTDRDGVYGAVKFVTACVDAGIAPLLGVDLAVEPSTGESRAVTSHRSSPARGGAVVDPRLPRVTVLAHAGGVGGLPAGAGWARLCRLVSATHLRGERGEPVSTMELVAKHARTSGTDSPVRISDNTSEPVTAGRFEDRPVPSWGGYDFDGSGFDGSGTDAALTVLLGPDSELGRALLKGRTDIARAVLARWYDALPLGALVVEVVCHLGPPGTPGSLGHAAHMLSFANHAGIPAVLTNAVRYATPDGAVTADVLDASRRLVPLSLRNTDRTNARGYLTSAEEMTRLAHQAARAAGAPDSASTLLRETERVAARCRLDPGADMGIGRVHLPEPHVVIPGWDPRRDDADQVLRGRCQAGVGQRFPGASEARLQQVTLRLDDELATIAALGYPTYFLTVAEVCDLIRSMGVRVAARGSGAGSLVNYLLGISGVDPLAHGLQMERFCTPLRAELPDIDIDVESARRTEVYERILERFGGERVSCVSMMDTYRVRHAVRDVGAALGMPPSEVDVVAKSFPHIRARDARNAIAELPELRASGLGQARLGLFFDLVERLDALPRHVALHPCGVLLSDATLGDRTPVEASWLGFPMSQFDKDDVEVLGLLKLDVLGIRMQSAMAHALDEIRRVDGAGAAKAGGHEPDAPYLDPETGQIDLDAVPLDDEATFQLVRSTRTLGCFQIESPGQRELVGKFAPETFADLVTDISLFRPGPVKSDMVTPFLRARQGWDPPDYLHPLLREPLEQTYGVVVFHEQVIDIVAISADVSRAEADEVRRALGSPNGQREVEEWWRPRALARGIDPDGVDRIWEVLKAFASFGFCKAHAAAFALPTYQSAWLKAHHPAAFLAGVLTHDPGMYPKRLILDDARNLGIAVLGLDVNASSDTYRVEKVAVWDEPPPAGGHLPLAGDLDQLDAGPLRPDDGPRRPPEQPRPFERLRVAELHDHDMGAPRDGDHCPPTSSTGGTAPADPALERRSLPSAAVPDGRAYGIRLSLADVKGISDAEVARVIAGQPYHSLADFWHRAQVSRPVAERLVVAGAFDSLYGLGSALPVRRRGQVTRRDLLLQLAELERWTRGLERTGRVVARASGSRAGTGKGSASNGSAGKAGGRAGTGNGRASNGSAGKAGVTSIGGDDVRVAAARQSQAAKPATAADEQPVQLALDLGDRPDETVSSGLPEMTSTERVRAELEVLGLDASAHVVSFYEPLLQALGVTRSFDLMRRRSRSELFVAGVKVATQTPPIRSGRRVVFLTLDDSHGPVDATFFEDVQGPYAATVFGSWLLLVRGVLRRTGPRGVSLRATGAWELPELWDAWTAGGLGAVRAVLDDVRTYDEGAVVGAAASRSTRPVMVAPPFGERQLGETRDDGDLVRFGGSLPAQDRHPAAVARGTTAARAGGEYAAASAGHGDGARAGTAGTGACERGDEGASADGRAAARGRGAADDGAVARHGTAADESLRGKGSSGGMGGGSSHRRVLVHASGFRQSPYADVKPPGDDVRDTRGAAGRAEQDAERRRRSEAPRKLWHSSPGSSGR